MSTFKEEKEKYNDLESKKEILNQDLQRIKGFKNRKVDNKDTANATDGDMILVKVAGTAFHMPFAMLEQYLDQREAELEQEVATVDADIQKFDMLVEKKVEKKAV